MYESVRSPSADASTDAKHKWQALRQIVVAWPGPTGAGSIVSKWDTMFVWACRWYGQLRIPSWTTSDHNVNQGNAAPSNAARGTHQQTGYLLARDESKAAKLPSTTQCTVQNSVLRLAPGQHHASMLIVFWIMQLASLQTFQAGTGVICLEYCSYAECLRLLVPPAACRARDCKCRSASQSAFKTGRKQKQHPLALKNSQSG
ncbi:hypothetical protein ABBQ38_015089 [Trebouxia sp. C0009 RCD-2024]